MQIIRKEEITEVNEKGDCARRAAHLYHLFISFIHSIFIHSTLLSTTFIFTFNWHVCVYN